MNETGIHQVTRLVNGDSTTAVVVEECTPSSSDNVPADNPSPRPIDKRLAVPAAPSAWDLHQIAVARDVLAGNLRHSCLTLTPPGLKTEKKSHVFRVRLPTKGSVFMSQLVPIASRFWMIFRKALRLLLKVCATLRGKRTSSPTLPSKMDAACYMDFAHTGLWLCSLMELATHCRAIHSKLSSSSSLHCRECLSVWCLRMTVAHNHAFSISCSCYTSLTMFEFGGRCIQSKDRLTFEVREKTHTTVLRLTLPTISPSLLRSLWWFV